MSMQVFSDRNAASEHAALLLSAQLTDHLAHCERASMVASGGSTPQACLEMLSRADLPWHRIDITVTDERHVPDTHEDSNQKMVMQKLLKFNASCASFCALNNDTTDRLQPFACTLVGMGDDGHFASLFPDSPQLTEGLESTHGTIDVSTPSSPYTRTSMTLTTLVKSQRVILLAFGDNKRRIIEAPTGYVLDHLMKRASAHVIWAP